VPRQRQPSARHPVRALSWTVVLSPPSSMVLTAKIASFASPHSSGWKRGDTPWQQGDDSVIQCWPSLQYDEHSCALPESFALPQQCSPSLFLQWSHPVGRHPVKALPCTKQGIKPPISFSPLGFLLLCLLFLFLPFCSCSPPLVLAISPMGLCVSSSMMSSLFSSPVIVIAFPFEWWLLRQV